MFRYISLIWSAGAERSAHAAARFQARLNAEREWQRAFAAEGLAVFCAGAQPGVTQAYVLQNQLGTILGTIFRRNSDPLDDSPSARAVFDQDSSEAIHRSRGARLMEHYWGRYVAFLGGPAAAAKWVVKDPTGNLPCYYTCIDGVYLFFSSLPDLLSLDSMDFSPNWDYVTKRTVYGRRASRETALEGIRQLIGGECIEIRGDELSIHGWWSPTDVASHGVIEDPDYAAAALRANVISCTLGWKSVHGRVLHELSGGLDSSIVLACLSSDSPSGVTAVTHYLPNGNSDERPYARLAAARAACDHIECSRDPSAIRFDRLLDIAPMVNPLSGGYKWLEFSDLLNGLAARCNASAVCSGDPGDAIFGALCRSRGAVDYVRRHGVRPALIATASELAARSGITIWSILWTALKRGYASDEWQQLLERQLSFRRLITAEAKQSVSARDHAQHPWYSTFPTLPPSVAQLISTLTLQWEYYDPLFPASLPLPEPIWPLLAQPVVELCLRLPSYIRNEHGYDRGLARRAFADEVPAEILGRHWKDRAAGQFEMMFPHNLSFFRELLLDGMLVKNGLLDRRRLEISLSGHPTREGASIAEITDHALTESWLRVCAHARQRAAA